VVVGGAIGLHFCILLLSGNDDVVSVPANVDDIVEVGCGEVEEIARLLLQLLHHALPPFGMFGVPKFVALLLSVILIFYLHNITVGELRAIEVVHMFLFWPDVS
jgi:hypothetical protein